MEPLFHVVEKAWRVDVSIKREKAKATVDEAMTLLVAPGRFNVDNDGALEIAWRGAAPIETLSAMANMSKEAKLAFVAKLSTTVAMLLSLVTFPEHYVALRAAEREVAESAKRN